MSIEKTSIDCTVGKPGSYHGIAYVLDKSDTEKLSVVRKDIKHTFGEKILLAPDGTLHITIAEITDFKDGMRGIPNTEFYEKKARLYKTALSNIAKTVKKFDIRFSRVETSKDAIILRGYGDGSIEQIRHSLSNLPTQSSKKKDVDFIHSTQARYIESMPINDAQKKVEKIHVDESITIDRLDIVRANIAFTEPHEILDSFNLQ